MTAGRQPPSGDDIPETALAALAEVDIPPDEDCPAGRIQIAGRRRNWRA